MPTYEYVCESCGYRFEQFQSIKAKPVHKCRNCGRSELRRLIGSGAGVIFKGAGFYQTDYRSESYKKAEKSEATANSEKKTKSKNTKSDEKTNSEEKNKKH